MWVAFEGIDGSGKTTVSNAVAQALTARGLKVEHVREGGQFASTVTRAIRELGRDARNLALRPDAELLVYLSREVQLFEEHTRPALARADVVIADRSLYSALVLSRFGRGLPAERVEPQVRAALEGRTPALTLLIDVDPQLARARRRVAKILTPDRRPPSRKGLAGMGLAYRLRDGYRALADAAPSSWLTVDNSNRPLDLIVGKCTEVVARAFASGVPASLAWARSEPCFPPPTPQVGSLAEAEQAFFDFLEERARTEPRVAAYLLSGMRGLRAHELRRRLVHKAPELVAYSLRGLSDDASFELRRTLSAIAPAQVASSLPYADDSERARVLRQSLAPHAPEEVARSLAGLDSPGAWELREELFARLPEAVLASARGVSNERAWSLRERWLETRGEHKAFRHYERARALNDSIRGLDDKRSRALRERTEAEDPVGMIESYTGLTSELAWTVRERYAESAPKTVMASLSGIDAPRAWEMREAAAATCKESMDSVFGLTGERARAFREKWSAQWPSTAVKTLPPGELDRERLAWVEGLLRSHPGNVSLWKHAAGLLQASATSGTSERS